MNNVVRIKPEEVLRAIERERESADNSGRPPSSGGGGPTLEARIAKLESTAEHVQRDMAEVKADLRELRRDLRTDFRLLFGALISVALGLAGLLAKGFKWL